MENDVQNLKHDLAMARAENLANHHFLLALANALARDIPELGGKVTAALATTEAAIHPRLPGQDHAGPAKRVYEQGIQDLRTLAFGAAHPAA